MSLHGKGRGGWVYPFCAVVNLVVCGMSIAVENWPAALAQGLLALVLWDAHYWRNRAALKPEGGS